MLYKGKMLCSLKKVKYVNLGVGKLIFFLDGKKKFFFQMVQSDYQRNSLKNVFLKVYLIY